MTDIHSLKPDMPKNHPDDHKEHVYGQWYPYNSRQVYRQCTLPYCKQIEIEEGDSYVRNF